MSLSPVKLFEMAEASRWPEVLYLHGNDEYLRRELKDLVRSQGFDLSFKDLKKKGPEGTDEDLSCATSLFQPRSFVWLESQAQPERWSEESKKIWKRMCERADGQGLVLCLQISSGDSDKAGSSRTSKKEPRDTASAYRFEVLESERALWLARMNTRRGSRLKANELRHLEGLDADLMTLDQYVELWTLGGDTWARVGVSYVEGEVASRSEVVSNPAYAWVDSILEAHPERGLKMLARLVKDGQDPLPLLGLLSKTLRIWATLEQGRTPRGEAPFLIDKVKRAMALSQGRKALASRRRQRGRLLLEAAAQMDVWFKSRPVDAEGLLVKLTTLSLS